MKHLGIGLLKGIAVPFMLLGLFIGFTWFHAVKGFQAGEAVGEWLFNSDD